MRRAKAVGVLGLALAIVAANAGCGRASDQGASYSEVTGVIVRVEGEGSAVTAFTVDADGDEVDLLLEPGRNYGFDLAHLHEHAQTREPVRCRVESRVGRRYALEIYDA